MALALMVQQVDGGLEHYFGTSIDCTGAAGQGTYPSVPFNFKKPESLL